MSFFAKNMTLKMKIVMQATKNHWRWMKVTMKNVDLKQMGEATVDLVLVITSGSTTRCQWQVPLLNLKTFSLYISLV